MSNPITHTTGTRMGLAVPAADGLSPPAETHAGSAQRPEVRPLPPELTQKIGRQLGGRDRLNFALASKAHHATLTKELLSGALERQAQRSLTLGHFMALIGVPAGAAGAAPGTINALPIGLRADPLLALAQKIAVLPVPEQAPAAMAWRNAAAPIVSRCPSLQQEMAEHNRSTQLADNVATVNTLDEFNALLGSAENPNSNSIHALRPDLRIKPLVALGSRIPLLPEQDRMEAQFLFTSAIPSDVPAGLDRILGAALSGSEHLPNMAARFAVTSGETVQDVVRRSGLTDALQIKMLGFLEWGAAVRCGESVHSAAARCGITGEVAQATRYVAGSDLSHGMPLHSVIATYAITDANLARELAVNAFRLAHAELQNGWPLHLAISRYGVTDRGHIANLVAFAFDGAREAIRRGEELPDVINRFGLFPNAHVAELIRLRDEVNASRR